MKALVFGGTTEGREIARYLSENGVEVLALVATGYGEASLEPGPGLRVRAGRMGPGEMAALIREEGSPLVVDATHPYAVEATENIRAACGEAGAERIRVLRGEGLGSGEGISRVDSTQEAAELLARTGERALLTVGTKELAAFVQVPGYREKLYARILPDPAGLERCRELGFSGRHVIAMQGPFNHGLNLAMIRELGVDCLVTKDSGGPGGFGEKCSAAAEAGIRLIVVSRPAGEEGIALEQALELLACRFGLPPWKAGISRENHLFPLFVDLRGKKAVVVGGGAVGSRRAAVLSGFGVEVVVVSPAAGDEVVALAERGEIRWIRREYAPGDLEGAALAVAATSSREANHLVGEEAKELGIPVSVADRREECSFWFPAIVRAEGITAGLVSPGGDHALVRRTAQSIRERLGGQ